MDTNTATLLQPVAASVLAVSAGRVGAFAAAGLALIGVVIGGRALVRCARGTGSGNGRDEARVAAGLGLVAIVIGGVVTATADGGVGTGNGLGGAVVAMTLGLIALVVGGLARARSRPTA